ncbi:MAG: peptidylprolyl isomerase [Tannerella sp.]|jgi:peptidyl-prolyl cis-trans isomerase B (cyclophilin B)|nr:peptidylprolyl isomerase [Tannerella sp.]
MKQIFRLIALCCISLSTASLSAADTVVEIKTNMGTMKIRLYGDVPGHAHAFARRVGQGLFNGTLFTRVIPGFMIQGGAPDSRNASPGARTGFGDPGAEIMPEFNSKYFHKKGVLAAPRQDVSVNPQKKSDMSQFFIVQGKIFTSGQLDTLELAANRLIRRKAMEEFYHPVKAQMDSLLDADRQAYNRHVTVINAKVDSMIRATPGHLIFTPEQREAYTTAGGSPHLDGEYTIYGEMTEGFDVLDAIAARPRDAYDRPLKDIRIVSIQIISSE